MIAMEAHIQRNREVVYADMDGDTVMFSLEQDEYYGFNDIAYGSPIFKAVQKKWSPAL